MANTSLDLLNAHACFGGAQRFYQHRSGEIGLPMKFSVYLPPQALQGAKAPALIYLAGLTFNEDTFITIISTGADAKYLGVPGEADNWDFGVGAGFYLDATQAPWNAHWRMESYLTHELLPLLAQHLPIDLERVGIFGHSMGGHGALTLALRHPGMFKSLSALAPISAPTRCSWGRKAFTGYLGSDAGEWRQHDASVLMASQEVPPYPGGILIDQGLADKFLLEKQLLPEAFEAACAQAGQPLTLRRQPGYDHGYYFVQSFIGDHLHHHAQQLR